VSDEGSETPQGTGTAAGVSPAGGSSKDGVDGDGATTAVSSSDGLGGGDE
jgi:hypothetical protein